MAEPVTGVEASSALRLTKTQEVQQQLQNRVFDIYNKFINELPPNSKSTCDGDVCLQRLELLRDQHIAFVRQEFGDHSSKSPTSLDANRPWLCYWMLHSLALLRQSVDDKLKDSVIDFLNSCQDSNGGYGGGPGQMPHLCTTYAAVNSLITLGGNKAFSSINRENMRTFLLRMKDRSGGCRMHVGGEIDVRACYTAISVACVLNILDDELVENVGNFVLSCQTYEGGIAGEPGSEAHGGYTFCGLATMIIIKEVNRLDLRSLLDWVLFRQGVEGGFQGRINKLVDVCYSFWQGGVTVLIQRLGAVIDEQFGLPDDAEDNCSVGHIASDSSDGKEFLEGTPSSVDYASNVELEEQGNACDSSSSINVGSNTVRRRAAMEPLFCSVALQKYILLCSQMDGGFRDKPGAHVDYYHTCYGLSGLSVSQYCWSDEANSIPLPGVLLGPYNNLLEPVHPIYNVVLDRYHEAREFFSRL